MVKLNSTDSGPICSDNVNRSIFWDITNDNKEPNCIRNKIWLSHMRKREAVSLDEAEYGFRIRRNE